jgi:hypothetical protein
MHTSNEIASCLKESSRRVHQIAIALPDDSFSMVPPEGKWSPAEHLDHLTRSVQPLNRVLSMPRMVLRFFGRPNRQGRTYEELRQRYREKLTNGATAIGRYIPRARSISKEALIRRYEAQMGRLVCRANSFKEEELDRYLLPHPLLGKITLREMFFFTIYHTYHHLEGLKRKED